MKHLLSRLDPQYTKVCLYASVTVLLTLAAALVLYFASGFFANLWQLICAVVEPAVFGALIAYLLNPLVTRVSHVLRRVGWLRERGKIRRLLGIMATLLVLALAVLGIVVVMALVVTRSIEGVNFQALERMWNDAYSDVMRLAKTIASHLGSAGAIEAQSTSEVGAQGAGIASVVTGAFKGVASFSSTMLFSIIFSVYYLMDGNRVGGYALRVMRAALGERATDKAMVLLDDADHVFSGYIRGQFLDALVVGILTSIALTLAGVPYGPIVGLLTGLGNLIPYVGAPLGILTTLLVCAVEGNIDKSIIGVLLLAVIMFVDSNVINPKLLSDNIEVHPLLVVGALIAGGAVGGLVGMLVAVPAAAFLKIQLDRWLVARESQVREENS